MSFTMDMNNFEKHEVEDNYAPIPKGMYQVDIAEASFDYGTTKSGNHIGKNRTLLKLKVDVYNATQDGNSRPMWINLVLEHDAAATDSGIMNMIKKNMNNLFDLVTQVIRNTFGGNVQASQFAQGITADNAHELVGNTIWLDLYVNKKKENEVGSFFPDNIPQVQQQNTQQNYQQQGNNQQQVNNQPVQQQNNNQQQNYQQQNNQQQVQQNGGNVQNTNQNMQPVHNGQNAGAQQNVGSHSNQQQPQGSLPPFAMQQQQQG